MVPSVDPRPYPHSLPERFWSSPQARTKSWHQDPGTKPEKMSMPPQTQELPSPWRARARARVFVLLFVFLIVFHEGHKGPGVPEKNALWF